MDDWKGASTQGHDNKDDYETMDNYFFGFSDSINNESKDIWESDNMRASDPPPFRISDAHSTSHQAHNNNSNKKLKYSPQNIHDVSYKSDISNDSFDSVKQLNREDNPDELKEISAKLMEKINVLKSVKSKQKNQNKDKGKSKFKPGENKDNFMTPSPMGINRFELPTVNEQDEINLKKSMKHRRVHSTSNNSHFGKFNYQQEVAKIIQSHKDKEIAMLTAFKVNLNFYSLRLKCTTSKSCSRKKLLSSLSCLRDEKTSRVRMIS